MIKMFFTPDNTQGRCMHKIANSIKKYSPKDKVLWVDDYKQADIVIESVFGDHKTVKARNNDEIIKHLSEKPFGLMFNGFAIPKENIQENEFFKWVFNAAKFIMTPWDLNGYYGFKLDNVIRTPWGIETNEFFYMPNKKKQYLIACTGCVSSSEAIQEIYEAVKILNGKMLHLGHNFGFDSKWYENRENVSVEEVRLIFNSSKFVSGLRRGEGFELPAVEGAACGARPICFDNPHYRDWFDKYAYFVKEDHPVHLIDSLVNTLSLDPAVPATMSAEIKEKFCWENINKNIWESIQRRLNV